ncbi:PREDICTED: PTI1-like tyrosine-protein kinase At3g15890 [Camelina sativa]|uniref:PTI1-like tyrosine-protein kinase At3g15890 n=1 Tax=Camelina sativa TaxID=90675 RepID=A0ABM0VWH8_CAMSA|nr:PREDICTED: PTI1-like tyrosine-protein kinase At3g15890 [Camelina sativa]XP_010462091.1 PREDICTED: PTI1-like tyrosine-protein kinase At3g15890 [Camelina sativa]
MQLFSCFCCGKGFDRKKKVKTEPSWRIFSLKELHAATNSFNYDNKLGEGRFGSVYWGQLWDGSQIAVKRLKAWSSREEITFAVEVEILARIRHKNLLSVRGYCAEGQERLIVYDYMPNLSLVSHLHGQHSSDSLLDWTRRMNIAVTSAQAIAYLHHFATPRIVHGDVRASNVLLDSEFEARVTDFGYGKMMPDDAGNGGNKITKGNNIGYLSPECIESGQESDMGDVYSFGVVLLELVTGKRPIERASLTTKQGITEWVLPLVYEKKFGEIVDQRLNGKYEEDELKRVVLIGLICAQREPEKRPTMSEVVEMLMNETKEKMSQHEANPLFNGNNVGELLDESSEITAEERDHQ